MSRKVIISISIILCIALGIVLLGCTFNGKTQNAATLSSSDPTPSDNPTSSNNPTTNNSVALPTEEQSDSTSPAADNSEKVLPSDTNSNPTLSSAEMVEDYNTMWTIIEENYPYMGVAERTTKKNFQEIKKMYSDKLKKVKNEKEFGTLIDSCLKEFAYCGHMNMISSDDYSAYLEIYGNGRDLLGEMVFKTLNNDVSKRFYNYNEKSGRENGMTGKSIANIPGDISTEKYDAIQTAYVKIPIFLDPQAQIPVLEEFFRDISSYKNCIIDIRGNGGGSESCWALGIVMPNLKKDLSTELCMLVKGEKSADYVKDKLTLYPAKDLDISAMPRINTKDLGDMDYYCKSIQTWNKSENPSFKGNFYVLTDSHNYSAAEAFVVFCKQTGFATLIGERTGGDGIGIDPMISVLPHSGICFRFSTLYGLNADGGSNEEYGTEPDISCKGKDALDVCLKHIKAQFTRDHTK